MKRPPFGTVTYATCCGLESHGSAGAAAPTSNSFQAKATATDPTALPQPPGPAEPTNTDWSVLKVAEASARDRLPMLLTSFCQYVDTNCSSVDSLSRELLSLVVFTYWNTMPRSAADTIPRIVTLMTSSM